MLEASHTPTADVVGVTREEGRGASSVEPVRLIDAGMVSAVRSQTVYHAVAHTMDECGPDTIILVSPAEPYVSIGFFQELEKEVDTACCRAHGLPVVRREVGGGAVLLDRDQLFVQWVFHPGRLPAKLEERFELFVQPLIAAYRDIGIDAYFRPVNDIHVAGKKIGGTGAARLGDSDVVVGSFMFDFDRKTMAKVLNVSSEKMRDKVVESLAQYMTTMRELLPEPPTRHDVMGAYVARCEEALGRALIPDALTQTELAEASRLDGVLASSDWLYQKGGIGSADVKIHEDVRVAEADHKAAGGLVRITARLRQNVLEDVAISGDFHMVPFGALSELEGALVGCTLESKVLEDAVSAVYTAQCVQAPGVAPADIVKALQALQR